MAAAGMLVAFALGVPLAVAIATRAPGYRLIVAALSSLRAIPDLTLAILAVVLLGLGPAAGIAALAVFYTAMVGRVFGDLFVAADAAPLEALRATGASRVAIAAFGLLPLTQADLLTFGTYAFECAMRASIIVGAVGGGGIGTELVGALSTLDFHRTLTMVIVLVALVAGVDSFGMLARRAPRTVLLLLPLGAARAVAQPAADLRLRPRAPHVRRHVSAAAARRADRVAAAADRADARDRGRRYADRRRARISRSR